MMMVVMKKNILLHFFLLILFVSCEKEKIIEEPKIIPLSSCGPLEYYHSMFVINNECWGVNPPEIGRFTQNVNTIYFGFRGRFRVFERFLGFIQLQDSPEKFILFHNINEGDGVLSSFQYSFGIEGNEHIKFLINQDSTEMECKIKNLVLKEGGGNTHIQYIPDSVVISEGSFRIRLEK